MPFWTRRTRPLPPTRQERAADPSRTVEACIQEGDRLRDSKNPAQAAEQYGAALALAPERTDIRVQFGNMLKDSGRYLDAEAAYRQAVVERPHDADVRLQLGHTLKLQGRRAAALAEYRHVVELDPNSAQAVIELASIGAPDQQRQVYDAQLRAGGAEALLTLVGEMGDMRRRLDQMLASLPAIQAWTAFPIAMYREFRRVFDIPPPPPACPAGFTVLLLADGEPLDVLYAQVSGMRMQRWADWRLLAIGTDPARREVIERAAAADPRFAWVTLPAEEAPAAAELRLAMAATTQWCLLLARGAVLHQHALGWIAAAGECGDVQAFICDEEVGAQTVGGLEYSSPQLRQVVDYDALLEANTLGGTVALRSLAMLRVAGLVTTSPAAARSSLLLHLAHECGVGHIPLPLVWRRNQDSDPGEAAAHREAVAAHLAASGSAARIDIAPGAATPASLPIVWQPQDPDIPVGVIIPTRDNAADVQLMVASLRATAANPDALHILVLDNVSRSSERQILEGLAQSARVRLLTIDEPFNWSRFNNRAVQELDTPLLVFANDDMEMLSAGWDMRLRGLLARPDIGAVGARLLYPDDTIQHAGVLLGWLGAGTHHDGLHEPEAAAGPGGRWQVTRSVSAVTGAFLATRRDLFLELGGFDEAELPVSFSDVDFALKVRAAGSRVLWTPRISLYHHESKSRGLDHLDAAKTARNAAEERVLQTRWGKALQRDPGVKSFLVFGHPAIPPPRAPIKPTPTAAHARLRLPPALAYYAGARLHAGGRVGADFRAVAPPACSHDD